MRAAMRRSNHTTTALYLVFSVSCGGAGTQDSEPIPLVSGQFQGRVVDWDFAACGGLTPDDMCFNVAASDEAVAVEYGTGRPSRSRDKGMSCLGPTRISSTSTSTAQSASCESR